MTIQLPKLPYAHDALEPHMSRETLDFHYGKHHRKYVDTANKLIKGTEYENMEPEEIIRAASGDIFNNVAQAWNHEFFWNCLTPNSQAPGSEVSEVFTQNFGDFDTFKAQFTEASVKLFGSGWTWLVADDDGKLHIEQTSNAETPLRRGRTPLLCCDVWEHAYYIDHRNARPKYLESYWKLVNWEFVAENYLRATATDIA
jgi:superoxide dismutase, Fe-Mn family